MIRYKLIFVFLLLVFLGVTYQTSGQVPVYDTVAFTKIQVPEAMHEEFKNNSSFQYNSGASDTHGLIERFLLWLSRLTGLNYLVQSAPVLLYSLLIAAFVVLLVVLFRSQFQGIFLPGKSDKGAHIGINEIDENINLEDLHSEALKNGNFNLAVRYLYLILLRKLNNLGMIAYKPEKTNLHYLSELKESELIPQFRELTRNYEYAWYGQFPVDGLAYKTIEEEYQLLTRRLHD